MSLLPYLTSKGLTCLNEDTNHALRSIVGSEAGPKGRNWLESDVDPEMLIALPVSDRPLLHFLGREEGDMFVSRRVPKGVLELWYIIAV
jgi:hypothetical protein